MKNSIVVKPCLIIVATILLLTGCEEKAKPFEGETYQSIGGTKVVRIYSPDELEVKEGNSPNIVAKYTTEDGGNKLRVVITALGTTQAVYYTITKEGIVDEDGITIYSSANLVKAREDHYCSAIKFDLEELANAQNSYKRKKNQFIVSSDASFPWGFKFRSSAGVSVDLSGASKGPGAYFIALATHKWCSNAYIWASASGGLQKPVFAKQAAGKIEEISVKADQEMEVARKKAEDERLRKENEARLAREKAEKIAREKMLAILTSGKSYFGQEDTRRKYPFRISFESFDKSSGAVSGIMDYYPENDRSIIKFRGMLKGSTLTYQLKEIVRKGESVPGGKYAYRAGKNRLEGTISSSGKVWINISEKDRKAKGLEVSALERRLKLIKESRTATKEIATILSWPVWSSQTKITLTDVSLKGFPRCCNQGDEEIYFGDITDIKKSNETTAFRNKICKITLGGNSERIVFRDTKDYQSKCNIFYDAFSKAFKAWRKKYTEILEKK